MNIPRKLIISLLLLAGFSNWRFAHAEIEHHDPHWDYMDQENWGELQDSLYHPPFPYAECGIGHKQSPVNIEQSNAITTDMIDELGPHYVKTPLSLTNNGHTLRVNVVQGKLNFGHSEYELLQFHFHAPSEHLVNGAHFPMEIHFVHGTADGRIAVVGVFIKPGSFNPTFQTILEQAPVEIGRTTNKPLAIHPTNLIPKTSLHFYTYAGSLTTPPCSEGVQWFVLAEAIELSVKQINAFKSRFYHDNARLEQRLNGRRLEWH